MKLSTKGKIALILAIIVVIVGVPLLGAFVYARSIGIVGESEPGPDVNLQVPHGATATEVGRILEQEGVIDSAFGFRVALFLHEGDENIQAGKYEVPRGLTPADALDVLLQGPIVEFVTVTFPEGSWLTDFARIVEEDAGIDGERFLELATSGTVRSKYQPEDVDTLEGLLFPSTYQVVEDDTARTVLERLVEEFEKQADEADLSRARSLGVTAYEAIIVASMVEAETRVASERGKVARVIYNRIDAGDRLGIDATVLYALGEHKDVLTQSDLEVDSPYNTRLYPGLPPTPIGAPGLDALRAAADPPEGDWYFYVLADCEGNHAFSESAEQFARDKAAYQELDC